MYIDTISSTLNAVNQTAEMLEKQKANSVQQALAQAQLLRDMGLNAQAQEQLQKASDTGILGTLHSLASPSEAWKAKNPFSGNKLDMLEKTGLEDLKKSPELYGGVNAAQGGILADLLDKKSANYNPDMYNYMMTQEAAKLGSKTETPPFSKASAGALGDVLLNREGDYSKAYNKATDLFNKQVQEYKTLQADQKAADKETAAANKPIIEANKQGQAWNDYVDKENAKREAYNKTVGSQYLEGNEEGQQKQLIEDTLKAVKAGGGMDAYLKYITMNKAINDHYGHKTMPLDPKAFGIGLGDGGKGEKKLDYYIRDEQGNKIKALRLTDAEINDPNLKLKLLGKYGKELVASGINHPDKFSVHFGSGTGENPDEMKALEVDLAKDSLIKKSAKEMSPWYSITKEGQAEWWNKNLDDSGDTKTPRISLTTGKSISYNDYVKQSGTATKEQPKKGKYADKLGFE